MKIKTALFPVWRGETFPQAQDVCMQNYFFAHGAASSPFTYLPPYLLVDFSKQRVPNLMQLKRVSSAFRRLAWRKTPYLLTYLSTFPENVKNVFRPPARKVSKTFARMLRGF